MTQTTTTATSPGSQGVVATGVLTTTVTDDSILASGWSVPIAVTDDSYFTSTPAAGKAALIQFSPDNVNWYFAASTPYVGVFTGGVPPSTLWIRAQGVGGIGALAVSTPTMNIGVLTAAQAAAVVPTLRDPTAPNGGMGKLIASFNTNSYPSMTLAGTVQNPAPYPVRLTLPGNFRPLVFTAVGVGVQHYCMAELGEDAVATVVSLPTTSITPASVPANTTAEQIFSVATIGLARTDRIFSMAPPSFQAGLRIDRLRVNNTDSLAITWTNTTGSPITPNAGVYTLSLRRCTTGAQSSSFNSLGVWLSCPPRADGFPYTAVRIYGYSDPASTNGFSYMLTVKADGRFRFYITGRRLMAIQNSFVLGVDRFDYMQIGEAGGAAAIPGASGFTTTSIPTMTAWGSASDVWHVQFSDGTSFAVREVQLTNGATSATWLSALPFVPTSAVYSSTVFKQGAADTIEIGPLYRDPVSKPFAFVRFDDCLADHVVPRQTLVSPFVGISGVTIPSGVAYSAATLAQAFGLKPTAAILTSCVGKDSTFATAAQLLSLQNTYGWCIGFQTHLDSISAATRGIQLLGPYGYNLKANTYSAINAVAASVVTTSAAHTITYTNTTSGTQGFPVELMGPTPPAASLVVGQKVWLRNTTTTAFTIHLTEFDACNNLNIVSLSDGAISWDYRYWGSSPDNYAAQLAEFTVGQALMQGWGLNGWRHWLPNQGAFDASSLVIAEAMLQAKTLRLISGIQGITGEAASSSFTPRIGIGYASCGFGAVGSNTSAPFAPIFSLPVSYQTDVGGGTQQAARDYVRALITYGAIGGNFHHGFSAANMLVLCAYMDEIKYNVDRGLLLTGNLDDLWSLLVSTGTAD